ncbi:MAG: hypothetical protein KTR17_12195, partial [Cellvibrionaceae bacterium]|nr:hypothetical protein [Cellvibrionaceae bacterium]
MSDFVDIRKQQQRGQSSEDSLHEYIIAAMCDGCRLFFVFDQRLDTDLQPSPADFSVAVGDNKIGVHACSLKCEIRRGKPWSLISLLLDQHFEPGTQITLHYHPRQWFLCTADSDESIDPFQVALTLAASDVLPGVSLELEPQAVETVREVSATEDVGAQLAFAYDRSVTITFGQELNLAFRPPLECFRAESEDQWLDIATVHLARNASAERGQTWPELLLMLRRPLREGSEIQIAYKPDDRGLITADGVNVSAFRVSGRVAEEELTEHSESLLRQARSSGHSAWQNAGTDNPATSPESLAGGEDSIPLIKNERSTSRNEPPASPQAENPVPDLESEWLVAQQSMPEASDSENPDHSAALGQALASSNSANSTDLARAGLSLTALEHGPELDAKPSSAAKPFNAPAPGQVLRTY